MSRGEQLCSWPLRSYRLSLYVPLLWLALPDRHREVSHSVIAFQLQLGFPGSPERFLVWALALAPQWSQFADLPVGLPGAGGAALRRSWGLWTVRMLVSSPQKMAAQKLVMGLIVKEGPSLPPWGCWTEGGKPLLQHLPLPLHEVLYPPSSSKSVSWWLFRNALARWKCIFNTGTRMR